MAGAYVYIITNKKLGTLYTGVTTNLGRRIYEHKNKLYKGFTKKYGLTKLVFYETHCYIFEAIMHEKKIKHWPRQWKINLIESRNPGWHDLAESFSFDGFDDYVPYRQRSSMIRLTRSNSHKNDGSRG